VSSPSTVGFIGVGAMGTPMIQRLASHGFGVRAYDVDSARVSALESPAGIQVARTISDVAGCALVICMLPSSPAVLDVVEGPGGLLRELRPGSLIVDMGSSEPAQTIRLAGVAKTAGCAVVDAPVSGGVAGARAGTLSVMFGGTETELIRCRPVLEALGGTIAHVGGVGSGHAMKALNNLLSAIGQAAAAEVIDVGERFGLDPQVMVDVLNQSSGQNNATSTKYAQFVLSGTFASGFRMQLMLKDVRTAVEMGRLKGVAMPLGEVALGLWEGAAAALPSGADQTELARWARARPATADA
jgi:3-hydroxyisobutyrate dehydrogenase